MADESRTTQKLIADMESALFRDTDRDRPSAPLFHYTDAAGFQGVIESKELWATHFEYLNDRSELRLGEKIVAEEAEAIVRELPEKSARRLILENFLALHPTTRLTQVGSIYLASLSEHGDLLSQWRAYGSDGSGYSISVSSMPNPGPDTPEAPAGLILMKCEYDSSAFRVRARTILLEVAAGFEKFFTSARSDGNEKLVHNVALSICFRRIAAEVPRLKHSAFREEAEWRLVAVTSEDHDREVVRYRSGRGGLTPYVAIPIADPGKPINLAQVVIGPSHDVQRSRRTATMFLRHHGYNPNVLQQSRAPYRGRAV